MLAIFAFELKQKDFFAFKKLNAVFSSVLVFLDAKIRKKRKKWKKSH